jgi:hypothetical protein
LICPNSAQKTRSWRLEIYAAIARLSSEIWSLREITTFSDGSVAEKSAAPKAKRRLEDIKSEPPEEKMLIEERRIQIEQRRIKLSRREISLKKKLTSMIETVGLDAS